MEQQIKKPNELIKSIINHEQWLFILGGILLIAFGVFLEKLCKPIATILEQIGGTLLTIGVASISYEKWKARREKNNEKYFLMGPSFLGSSGEELKPIANIDNKSGKIFLIGSMSDENIKKGYAYTTLLNGDNFKLLNTDKPMLSYGTTFFYLNKKEKPEYYKVFKEAIEKGLGLNVSIIYPSEKVVDFGDIEDWKRIKNEAEDTIEKFKDLMSLFIDDGIELTSPIELRLSKYLSPCSFSSLEFNNGRTIRTLEFNFMHEIENGKNVKLAQVHDNPPITQIHDTTSTSRHGDFSKYLYNRYNRLYKESFLALRYPMPDTITYYVLGIITDIPKGFTEQRKFAILNANELYEVTIQLEIDKNRKTFKLLPQASKSIPDIPENTIIGNVLSTYETQTKCKITPIRSFEIGKDSFLLLGNVVKTPMDMDKMEENSTAGGIQITNFSKGNGEIDDTLKRKLRSIHCTPSIIGRINTIITTS